MSSTTARGRPWLAAAGGAVAGAAVTVAVILGLGWTPDRAPDDEPITLPDTVVGLRTEAVVMEEARGEPFPGRQEALLETVELLSASRGGAAAAVQSYLDEDLDERFTVWAVADESPGLWSSQDSEIFAEASGLASPTEWVERDGEVECLVRPWDASYVRQGMGEVVPRVVQCQLAHEGMTLLLEAPNQDTVSRPASVLQDIAANLERG